MMSDGRSPWYWNVFSPSAMNILGNFMPNFSIKGVEADAGEAMTDKIKNAQLDDWA